MDGYQHLTWNAHSTLSWRGGGTTSQIFTKSLDTTVEVWIGSKSTFFRVNMPSTTPEGELETVKQEFELRPDYAIMQFYDCREPPAKDKIGVCFLNVIPEFGDTRTSDVSLLQFPMTHLFSRLLLSGKFPTVWNDLKFDIGPDKFELNNWDSQNKRPKNASDPAIWRKFQGEFENHKIKNIIATNGFDGSHLICFNDIDSNGSNIVGFTLSDERTQAKNLLMTKTDIRFELSKVDASAPNIEFKRGATVFDFRLCKPVSLTHFPNKDCPPKSYKWNGMLPPVSSLSGQIDARYDQEPSPKRNGTSPFFVGIFVLALVALIASFVWSKKRKA